MMHILKLFVYLQCQTMKIIHIMKSKQQKINELRRIDLQIGGKWYLVAKVAFLNDNVLNAIINSYACVDAYRVDGIITKIN